MDKEKYLASYESLFQERTPEDYNLKALAELNKQKKYWGKEQVPSSKGLLGMFIKKTRLTYHPQHYLYDLISAAEYKTDSMPYTALYQVQKGEDFSILQNALFQACRLHINSWHPLASGYDHCIGFARAIYGIAAADTDCVEKLLPLQAGASSNGHTVLRALTNVLMGLWYKDANIFDVGYQQTTKLLSLKSTKKQDSALGKYFIALADKDATQALEALSSLSKLMKYSKGDNIIPLHPLGQYFTPEFHGLINLAYFVLGKEFFGHMANFDIPFCCKEYTEYLLKNDFLKPEPYFIFTDELEILNELLLKLPETHVYKEGRMPFVDVERYKKDRLTLLEKNINLEEYFRRYNS